jgi:hypothetical protein
MHRCREDSPSALSAALDRRFASIADPAALRVRRGGLLVVGKAERPNGIEALVRVGSSVYRKVGP